MSSRPQCCALIASFLLLPAVPHAALPFADSCGPEHAAELERALAQLHSFEYPTSGRLFGELLATAPDCPMARWGAAMSLWHPLWAPPSAAELRVGARLLGDIEQLAATPRERGYLRAAVAFFADDDVTRDPARRAAFSKQMRDLYEAEPGDAEAAAFYALSLLAVADPQDKSYANQFRAGAILYWLRESQPRHPGVLHYLIHSFDFPGLAHLALGAAMSYAEAAPDSAHAQHMPSHIFTRLGLWERSLASNHDSTASAADYTRRAGLPGHYDEGLHSLDYLMYAMLQTARDDQAAALLRTLRGLNRTYPENFKVAFTYAASPARYALERRDWQGAADLELGFPDFPWNDYPWAQAIHHFARGIGAARSGRSAAAENELAAIVKLRAELAPTVQGYLREEMLVQEQMLEAWITAADGRTDEALLAARAAADREDAVDKHPVTPGEVLPARELYADLLLDARRFDEALAAYLQVLAGAPNRFNALLGAARAAKGAGLTVAAERHYGQLVEIAAAGSPDRAGLVEARRFLP